MVWILAVATVLLCFLLIGQAVYQFRDLIAAAYPPVKNTLVTMCKLARCQIQLPAQLDAVPDGRFMARAGSRGRAER